MPFVKQKPKDFIEMERLVRGYGVTGTSLASIIGVSPPTGVQRIKNPEQLTLRDLKKISQNLHIPKQEILDAIKW